MFATCVWFILQGNQGQIWNQLIKLVILIYNIYPDSVEESQH